MPLPPDAERSLREIQAWERQHPGHCGRCCLPLAHCYHVDPGFRSATRRVNYSAGEYGRVTMEWHKRALQGMTTKALQALPEPRRQTKRLALVEELRRRGEDLKKREDLEKARLTWPTRYQRLMADEDAV